MNSSEVNQLIDFQAVLQKDDKETSVLINWRQIRDSNGFLGKKFQSRLIMKGVDVQVQSGRKIKLPNNAIRAELLNASIDPKTNKPREFYFEFDGVKTRLSNKQRITFTHHNLFEKTRFLKFFSYTDSHKTRMMEKLESDDAVIFDDFDLELRDWVVSFNKVKSVKLKLEGKNKVRVKKNLQKISRTRTFSSQTMILRVYYVETQVADINQRR